MSLISIFYSPCGHNRDRLPLEDYFPSEDRFPSCAFPPKCHVVDRPCQECCDGQSTALLPEAREVEEAAFNRLKACTDKYFDDLSRKNEPLETELCSIAPDALSIVQVRQLHIVHHQLVEGILGFSWTLEEHNRADPLEEAIAKVPNELLSQLTMDERFIHLEILEQQFTSACFRYRHRHGPDIPNTGGLFQADDLIVSILSLMNVIRVQIQLLSIDLKHDEDDDTDTNGSETPIDFIDSISIHNRRAQAQPGGDYISEHCLRLFRNRLGDLQFNFGAMKNEFRSLVDPFWFWDNDNDEDGDYPWDDYADNQYFDRYPDGNFPQRGDPRAIDHELNVGEWTWTLEYYDDKKGASHDLVPVAIEDIPTEDRTCSICREEYPSEADTEDGDTPVKLPCGHIFGFACITTWLHNKSQARNCPTCRSDAVWFWED
ncbi:hypothetical protein L207DRAFT_522440 [Hyaloscypha variabilis F]|uniref:RING-type domain-containing protein n=1 Tax=Hyaloscypha variabilis (strain UAMH 11265 / GT02V1 / F) TaxID=1149755 RepID=A0A2J6S888_HYAVF|nr:hypothetical protein L207DRAFT_522440 [Hyaloscypha variabilis F]